MKREDSRTKVQLIAELEALRRRVAELEGARSMQRQGEYRVGALAPTEEKYRALVETTGTGFVIIDGEGRVRDANAEYVRLSGRQRVEEILGRSVVEWTVARDRERNGQAVRQCFTEGQIRGFEVTYVDAEGHETPIVVNATVVDDRGAPLILTLCRDISVRKRMEAELLDSKRALEAINASLEQRVGMRTAELARALQNLRDISRRDATILNTTLDGFCILDASLHLVEVNEAFCAMTGYAREELLAMSIADLEARRPPEAIAAHFQKITEQESDRFETLHRRKDGQVLTVEACVTCLPETGGLCGFFRNITDRKQAEDDLRRLNRALRIFSECNQVIVRTVDEHELLQRVCGMIVEIGGYGLAWVGFAEDNKRRSVRPVASSADRPGYLEGIRVTWDETASGRGPAGTAIRTGEPIFTRDIRTDPHFTVWRDAAIAHGYLSVISLPLKTSERVIGALLVYAHEPDAFDANETQLLARLADNLTHAIMALRMRAERDDARQGLESLARFPSESPDPVMRIAQNGVLLYANRASTPILEQFGLEVGQAIPETWRAWMTDAFDTERNKEVVLECVSRLFSIVLAPNPQSGYANLYGRDITARVKAEKLVAEQRMKMIESARLSSLGTMAGGIAHEVNNPLAIIAGCAEQLEELVTNRDVSPETIIDRTQMVRRNADRIQKIVQGLRNLSRDASADPFVSVAIGGIIASTIEICQSRFRNHDVWLEVLSPIPAVFIECRPPQISQLILNLLNNSFDAVENLPTKWVRLGVADLGKHAQVSVTDSGSGISEDIADRLFVPFFTTKSEQRGLGLGLSISRAIVEAHHGEITVDTVGDNTRFMVSLPKRHEPPSAG